MNSYYNSTPYKLNLKLKKLNRNLSQDFDLNRLYNNLNESMPLIANQFCSLKNRTKILNKALSKIPVCNINTDCSYYNNLSRSILTSPIKTKSTNYYNIAYKSPQPVLKPLNKIDNDFTNYQNISIYKNKINNNNGNPNRLHHKYSNSNYNLAYKRNNIYNDTMKNNIKNRINKSDNTNSQYFSFKNNIALNNYNNDKDKIEQKFKKLNQQIYEKDKIINEMKGIIDNTYNKLNKKNQENSMLQSEIMELKSRYNDSNYNDFKNSNIQENSRYNNTYNNYNIEKEFIYPNKRKHMLNYAKNNDQLQRSNYNSYNFNGPNKGKTDIRCEEIRKINKKMDNLLNKNENNIKRYERIRKNYNYKLNA